MKTKAIYYVSWILVVLAICLILTNNNNIVLNYVTIGLSLIFDAIRAIVLTIAFIGYILIKGNILAKEKGLDVPIGKKKLKELSKNFDKAVTSLTKSKHFDFSKHPLSVVKHFLWGICIVFIGYHSGFIGLTLAIISLVLDDTMWLITKFKVSKLKFIEEKDLSKEFSWTSLKKNIKSTLNVGFPNNIVSYEDNKLVVIVLNTFANIKHNKILSSKNLCKHENIVFEFYKIDLLEGDAKDNIWTTVGCIREEYGDLLTKLICDEIDDTVKAVKRRL